jgi:DNA modification methylase
MTDYRNVTLYGDNRKVLRELIDAGVRCNLAVTSPPYFNLRSYLPSDSPSKPFEIGNEQELGDYIDTLVEVFSLVRELLYDDGSLWVVISDSYAGSGGAGGQTKAEQIKYRGAKAITGMKQKDLCLVPSHFAIAMREAGWWVRCDVIWHKPSCLPPYASDRPLRDHEYVWVFSKTADAYYDEHAVRIFSRQQDVVKVAKRDKYPAHRGEPGSMLGVSAGHHLVRSTWSINPESLQEAHFAAYPTELASRIIRLASSERGHCPNCGAGFKRIIEKGEPDEDHKKACGADSTGEYHGQSQKDYLNAKAQDASATKARILESLVEKRTVGWEPGCKCGLEPIPALVLDPFLGSGRTAKACELLDRDYLGIELNRDFESIIKKQTGGGRQRSLCI